MDGFDLPSLTGTGLFFTELLSRCKCLSPHCELLKRFLLFSVLFFFLFFAFFIVLPQKNKQQTAQCLDMVGASKYLWLDLCLCAV